MRAGQNLAFVVGILGTAGCGSGSRQAPATTPPTTIDGSVNADGATADATWPADAVPDVASLVVTPADLMIFVGRTSTLYPARDPQREALARTRHAPSMGRARHR